MSLPIFQTTDQTIQLMQTKWKGELDPVLANPILAGFQLKNQALINGVTVIPHKLSRMMQGWFITDVNGAATIYRSQPLSATTLTLTSSAGVTCNIWVY